MLPWNKETKVFPKEYVYSVDRVQNWKHVRRKPEYVRYSEPKKKHVVICIRQDMLFFGRTRAEQGHHTNIHRYPVMVMG